MFSSQTAIASVIAKLNLTSGLQQFDIIVSDSAWHLVIHGCGDIILLTEVCGAVFWYCLQEEVLLSH